MDAPDQQTVATPRRCAAILAGGQAARYGGLAKGLLSAPGQRSLIARLIGVVTSFGVCETAIFATDAAPYAHLGLEVVPDRRPGLGPIAGIETALGHFGGRCEAVLLLPCDMPAITERELRALWAAFQKSKAPVALAQTPDGGWHPLCAIARADLGLAVSKAIDEGVRSVQQLWRLVGAVPVHFDDAAPFANINTPEDWQAFSGRVARHV